MTERIEILKITPFENGGNLRAFASVRLGDVVIHDLRVVQQPGQRAWVSMPQREYQSGDGTRKFAAVVELPEPLRREVSRLLLAAWERGGT